MYDCGEIRLDLLLSTVLNITKTMVSMPYFNTIFYVFKYM